MDKSDCIGQINFNTHTIYFYAVDSAKFLHQIKNHSEEVKKPEVIRIYEEADYSNETNVSWASYAEEMTLHSRKAKATDNTWVIIESILDEDFQYTM